MQIAVGCRKLNEVGNEIEIETNGKLTGGGVECLADTQLQIQIHLLLSSFVYVGLEGRCVTE